MEYDGKFQRTVKLIKAVNEGWDLADQLLSLYHLPSTLVSQDYCLSGQIKSETGSFHQLGIASPAHGPHAVSPVFSIPSLWKHSPSSRPLDSAQQGLAIGVATSLPHRAGIPMEDDRHGSLSPKPLWRLFGSYLPGGRKARSRIIVGECWLSPGKKVGSAGGVSKSGYKSRLHTMGYNVVH